MRTIDVDYLIQIIKHASQKCDEYALQSIGMRKWQFKAIKMFCVGLINRLNDGTIHTVDAEQVVRCKDCKHRNHDSVGRPWCDLWEDLLFDDATFCSYGERKEGEGYGEKEVQAR